MGRAPPRAAPPTAAARAARLRGAAPCGGCAARPARSPRSASSCPRARSCPCRATAGRGTRRRTAGGSGGTTRSCGSRSTRASRRWRRSLLCAPLSRASALARAPGLPREQAVACHRFCARAALSLLRCENVPLLSERSLSDRAGARRSASTRSATLSRGARRARASCSPRRSTARPASRRSSRRGSTTPRGSSRGSSGSSSGAARRSRAAARLRGLPPRPRAALGVRVLPCVHWPGCVAWLAPSLVLLAADARCARAPRAAPPPRSARPRRARRRRARRRRRRARRTRARRRGRAATSTAEAARGGAPALTTALVRLAPPGGALVGGALLRGEASGGACPVAGGAPRAPRPPASAPGDWVGGTIYLEIPGLTAGLDRADDAPAAKPRFRGPRGRASATPSPSAARSKRRARRPSRSCTSRRATAGRARRAPRRADRRRGARRRGGARAVPAAPALLGVAPRGRRRAAAADRRGERDRAARRGRAPRGRRARGAARRERRRRSRRRARVRRARARLLEMLDGEMLPRDAAGATAHAWLRTELHVTDRAAVAAPPEDAAAPAEPWPRGPVVVPRRARRGRGGGGGAVPRAPARARAAGGAAARGWAAEEALALLGAAVGYLACWWGLFARPASPLHASRASTLVAGGLALALAAAAARAGASALLGRREAPRARRRPVRAAVRRRRRRRGDGGDGRGGAAARGAARFVRRATGRAVAPRAIRARRGRLPGQPRRRRHGLRVGRRRAIDGAIGCRGWASGLARGGRRGARPGGTPSRGAAHLHDVTGRGDRPQPRARRLRELLVLGYQAPWSSYRAPRRDSTQTSESRPLGRLISRSSSRSSST